MVSAVNNVGSNLRKPTVEYTAEDYSLITKTNLDSAYNLTQVTFLLSLTGIMIVVIGTSAFHPCTS